MAEETLVLTKHEAIKRRVLGLKEKSGSGAPPTTIPITEIAVGERIVPEDPKVVAQLKTSMREVRQTTPILVRRSDAGYTLIDGLNRLAAMRELGETEVLATFLDVTTEEEAIACEAISNRHRRQGLTALDRALSDFAFVKYVASKVPQDAAPPGGRQPKEKYHAKTARELGVSPDQIARSCKIATIVPQVQRAIRNYGQENDQSLLLEVAASGHDYTTQIYTLTRLTNKVSGTAEQAWTDRAPPPADVGAKDSPLVTVAASSDDREIRSSGGQADVTGSSIVNTSVSNEGKQTGELASGHHPSSQQSVPASVRIREGETGVHQPGGQVGDPKGSDAAAGMHIELAMLPTSHAEFAKLADGATIRIFGVVRAPAGAVPRVEVQEIIETKTRATGSNS